MRHDPLRDPIVELMDRQMEREMERVPSGDLMVELLDLHRVMEGLLEAIGKECKTRKDHCMRRLLTAKTPEALKEAQADTEAALIEMRQRIDLGQAIGRQMDEFHAELRQRLDLQDHKDADEDADTP